MKGNETLKMKLSLEVRTKERSGILSTLYGELLSQAKQEIRPFEDQNKGVGGSRKKANKRSISGSDEEVSLRQPHQRYPIYDSGSNLVVKYFKIFSIQRSV